MMWQLAKDGYAMRGVDADEREFPRHVDGVIRGRSSEFLIVGVFVSPGMDS
jgi:hypothetical protein